MKSHVLWILTCVWLGGCVDHGVTIEHQGTGEVDLPNGWTRKVVKEVAPDYPAYLRKKRIAGAVVVRMWVQPDGSVLRAEARYSPHPELVPLATAAVLQWRFEPAKEGDKRVLVLEMPITFELRDPEKK
jgi:TonB family protein